MKLPWLEFTQFFAHKEKNRKYMCFRLILLLVLFKDVLGAKILAIMMVPSPSHGLWYTKYLEALLNRGHSITYVGVETIRIEHQNLRHITFDKVHQEVFKDEKFMDYQNLGPFGISLLLDKWDHSQSNYIKKSETFQRFLKVIRTENFDLVVNDLSMTPFMLGAVQILKNPPLIGICPFGLQSFIKDLLKNPVWYSSEPHSFLPFKSDMTFLERLKNYLLHIFYWGTRSLHMIEQNKHAKDAFGEHLRPLEEVLERMHIVLANFDEKMNFPFAKVPGLIPVGGLHIVPPKQLPKDLQSYLDSAEHGVIYFSLGTNLNPAHFAKEKKEILMEAFRQLAPIRILCKWDSEDIPAKPENVKILKWLPQNDLLAHSKLLLFFTHSGLLSTQEAIYHGVPMVGMSFLLDQHVNIKNCVERGIAEEINYGALSVEHVVEKIRKVIDDPKYKENIKRLSILFKDSMDAPLDRAMFWTEYAIRHKGAPHLSLAARKFTWYQNALIDIYLFIFIIIFLVIVTVYEVIKFLRSKLNNDTKMKMS